MPSLKEMIRARASAAGFELCGFAHIAAPAHGEFVRAWLDAGHAASMDYLGRGLEKRLDPTRLLAGARTVITLGRRYAPPPSAAIDWRSELRGRIAAYALGTDYHRVIEKKLKQLAAALNEIAPAHFRWYVDSGPVLEREWAAAGGVGWFGKNTNILHREQGSWFFLAELLTDLELEPDDPVADHCGTCTRCLDLCPTGALKPGYVLDSRLCISYWTIEHRGWIPAAIRPQLGPWVFGCDVCQEVCPWNEKFGGIGETAAELTPSLIELATMDEETFRLRYRGTAVLRAKREGLVRNACIALGNSANPAAAAPLQEALGSDPSAVVRGHAAWALGRLGGGEARAALKRSLAREDDGVVRGEIELALGDAGPSRRPG